MQTPLIHYASPDYWTMYRRLPKQARQTADKHFALLKSNPHHPSLHLKRIKELWAVRAGIHHREWELTHHQAKKASSGFGSAPTPCRNA